MSPEAQEQQRHQWLDAIGIDSWLPRAPLPGAASSPGWVDAFRYPAASVAKQEDSGVVYRAETPPQPPRSAGPRIDTAALLDEPRRPAAAAASVPAGTGGESPPARERRAEPVGGGRSEPAPRFKLAFLVRGDLLVIDSLPPHQPDGFSRYHRRLLQGITNALGMPVEEELSAPFMLPWPMLAGKTLNQGAEEARAAVRRKLQNTLSFRPGIRRLLLLGEAACHWVAAQDAGLDTLQGGVLELEDGRQALMTLSLSELLRLPERKAEVWRDLQPFRRR